MNNKIFIAKVQSLFEHALYMLQGPLFLDVYRSTTIKS